MHQVPLWVWNEIAMSQPLFPEWRKLFLAKDDQELETLMETVIYSQARGMDNRVQVALARVAPLLLENEAIQAYIFETGQIELLNALPEVNSLDEAITLACLEYELTQDQVHNLGAALRALQTTSGSSTGAEMTIS